MNLVLRCDLLGRLAAPQCFKRNAGFEVSREPASCRHFVSLPQSVEYTLNNCPIYWEPNQIFFGKLLFLGRDSGNLGVLGGEKSNILAQQIPSANAPERGYQSILQLGGNNPEKCRNTLQYGYLAA